MLLLFLILLRFRHARNLPLVLLVLVFSLRLGTIPSWRAEVLTAWPWLWLLTTPLPLLFGPLLWLYTRRLAFPARPSSPRAFLHCIPYLIELVLITITVYGMPAETYREFVASVFAGNPPLWLPLRNGLKVLVNIIYVVLTARITFDGKSDSMPESLRAWFKVLVILPAATLLFYAFVAISPAATARLASGAPAPFIILSGLMALLIYGISFLVLAAPQGLSEHGIVWIAKGESPVDAEESASLASAAEEKLMAGAYRNPDLHLKNLADQIGVHPNRLSAAINRQRGCSFNRLINQLRMEEFLRLAEKNNGHSLLDLALDAGFPSKSTFNRVFKEATGMSPSAYLEDGSTRKENSCRSILPKDAG